MRPTIQFLFWLGVGATCSGAAQGQTVTATTSTDVDVQARVHGGFPGFDFARIPAGTAITSRIEASATATGSPFSCRSCTGTASVTLEPVPNGLRVAGDGQVSAVNHEQVSASASGPGGPGTPYVLLTSFAGFAPGYVRIEHSGSTRNPIAFVSVDVDVGNDGSYEMRGGVGNEDIVVRVPSGATVVRVEVACRAAVSPFLPAYNFGRWSHDTRIAFGEGVPPARITNYGAPCGPTLTGVDNPTGLIHRFRFDLAGGIPNVQAACMFGTESIDRSIPATNCRLLTDPAVWFLSTSNGAGDVSWSFAVGGPIPIGTVFVQAVTFDLSPRIVTTDGLSVAIRD